MTTDVQPPPVTGEVERRPRHVRRVLLVALALLAVTVVVLAVWGALSAASLVGASRDVRSAQADVVRDLRAQDWTTAAADTALLQDATGRAEDAADSPPFRVGGWLPWIGDDVSAVRTVASSLDVVARETVGPLVDTAASLAGARATDGGLDLTAVVAAAPTAQTAAEQASAAEVRVAAIRTEDLVGALRTRVAEVQTELAELSRTTTQVARGAALLPPMLGSEGPRTHLLVFQNLAEARPTGGIFGSWAVVSADQGRLALVGTGSIEDLGPRVDGLDVPVEARALYGADLDLVANVNLSPDFPTSAGLMRQVLERRGYPAPDSVVAVDPVALAAMLRVTGPVEVAGTTVDGDSAVAMLMNGVYTTYDGRVEERKAYLQQVTATVFSALVAPGTDLVAVGRALGEEPVREHVMVWSQDPGEEEALASFGLTHGLSGASDGVAVHLTNADGSKLDYFLRTSVAATCTAGVSTVQVGLTNDAPAEVPDYVASKGTASPTTHRLIVSFVVPAGRTVSGVQVDGQAVPYAEGPEGGGTVVRAQVDVPRERTVSVAASLVGGDGAVKVSVGQPMVHDVVVQPAGPCS